MARIETRKREDGVTTRCKKCRIGRSRTFINGREYYQECTNCGKTTIDSNYKTGQAKPELEKER